MLTLRRCWVLWLPLGLTFLMVAGAVPVVSAGLRWLGDQIAADHALAAFSLAFHLSLMFNSPLFMTREIVMTEARDRASFQRTARFLIGVAICLSSLELLLAVTPLGVHAFGLMTGDTELFPDARLVLAVISVIPILVVIRGINQALLITQDRSSWVGGGTACRLAVTGLVMLVLVRGVPGWGALVGGIGFVAGIATEALVAVLSARRERRSFPETPAGSESGSMGSLLRFALPLMLGNMVGLFAMPFFTGVAGTSRVAAASIAAYAVVKTVSLSASAPVFSLQSLVTAKATSRENRRALARFAVLVGLGGSGALALITLVPAIRDPLLARLLNAPPGSLTHAFAVTAFPVAALMPALTAAKATMRAFLIRRRGTLWVALAAVLGIAVVAAALTIVGLGGDPDNRTDDAYRGWITAMGVEVAVLAAALWLLSRTRGAVEAPPAFPSEARAGMPPESLSPAASGMENMLLLPQEKQHARVREEP